MFLSLPVGGGKAHAPAALPCSQAGAGGGRRLLPWRACTRLQGSAICALPAASVVAQGAIFAAIVGPTDALAAAAILKHGACRASVLGCGGVWCGGVWRGVVWCGVVWCGVVWCGGAGWG
jgi:hypothetical protein